tara:strand:- start:5014 stop:5175 length:162 start_codon:yes stop_codon:yes gene_type:complete
MSTFILLAVVYLLLSDICRTVQEKKKRKLLPKKQGRSRVYQHTNPGKGARRDN